MGGHRLIVADDKPKVAAGALILPVALIGLLGGSRIAWISLVALEAVALASALFAGTPGWAFPPSGVALALLVARPTREHVGHARPRRPLVGEPR